MPETDTDLGAVIEAAARLDDGLAAREHLAAGQPIYFSDAATPAGLLSKEYPDGRRELVRFDADGEHRVQAAA